MQPEMLTIDEGWQITQHRIMRITLPEISEDRKEQARTEFGARVFKALGHPTRLLFVRALAEKDYCVCELKELVQADLSTISKHLSVLREAGVVSAERKGNQVHYHLVMQCVTGFMDCLEGAREAQIKEQGALL
jgi:DNA-binding transcriptional ArsR family regulator